MSLHRDSYEYVGTGGGGTPLLLIHGWGMHGGMWGGVAEKLAQHSHVFAVDLPGHGYSAFFSPASRRGAGGEGFGAISETLTLSRSRERGQDSLDAIVDELSAQFSEPLNICGWSLGGQVALRWAMRHPQQVQRLVLVASTPCFVRREDWNHAMSEDLLLEFAAALQQNYASTLRRFLALQVRGSEQERELLVILRDVLFDRGEPDLSALQWGLEVLCSSDLRSALPSIIQPALIVAGERDALTPLQASQYMAQQMPAGELARIKGAAHTPFLSHPEEFVKHVVSFLYG